MKEYRIMCDRVSIDEKGHSYVITGTWPLSESGTSLKTVFTNKDEAELSKERWEAYGAAYEEKSKAIIAKHPSSLRVWHQYNYRIQSREVSMWE